jgi:hypothetical protein
MKGTLPKLLIATVALLLLVGCSAEPPKIMEWKIAHVELSEDNAAGQRPERVIVEATIDNPSAAIKLLNGRMRVSFRGSRVAMLTLEEKVKIPACRQSRVTLTLKANFMHNSQTMALQRALESHNAKGIAIDFQARVRSHVLRGEINQDATALDDLLSQQQLDELWQAMDDLKNK